MEKDMEAGLYVSHVAVKDFHLNYQFWEPRDSW